MIDKRVEIYPMHRHVAGICRCCQHEDMSKVCDYLDMVLQYVHNVDMLKLANRMYGSLLIVKNGEGRATYMQWRPKLFTIHVSPFTAF